MKKILLPFLASGVIFTACSGDDDYCLYSNGNGGIGDDGTEVPVDPTPVPVFVTLPKSIMTNINGTPTGVTFDYEVGKNRITELSHTDGSKLNIAYENNGKITLTDNNKSTYTYDPATGKIADANNTEVATVKDNHMLKGGWGESFDYTVTGGNLTNVTASTTDYYVNEFSGVENIFRNTDTPAWIVEFFYSKYYGTEERANPIGVFTSTNLVSKVTYTNRSDKRVYTYNWSAEEFPIGIQLEEVHTDINNNPIANKAYDVTIGYVEQEIKP